ncbi:hypothetical protein CLV24_12261 [Pontibacter ummariensis]|uniref:Uncharacterized protein n=1 Tax=Pontibacter ummariensis TaxID=1610492 RepID=A0A239JKZ7_9BACT|nr:hypothetical protein [Pontibacter ummariensis]PRY07871.1 hypothetical protein CLV24_12261 [Pontibacter ummariensis]SNT06517.1 hypothetical protein SAMN06296052_12261 [Pontibacter ummariensis]
MRQLLSLILFLAVFSAQAQVKFSNDPAEFVKDAKAMLSAGKVDHAEELSAQLEELWSSGKLTERQKQQVIKVSQLLYRKRMRANPHFEQFYTMLLAGVGTRNLSGVRLDNMLEVTAKAIGQEEPKQLEKFLTTASLYLSANRLFQNTYYSLHATGGSFSFAYEGPSKPTETVTEEDSWDSISWDDEVNETGEATAEEDDAWGTITSVPEKEDKKKTAQKRKESLKQQFIPAQPKVSGPVLQLQNVTLAFVTPWDSAAIVQTNGQLMLGNDLFVGEGGKFEWQVQEKPAVAELRKYSFNISFAGFKAPDVTISYPAVLAGPIDGPMEWVSRKRKTSKYPYPKFLSFTNDAKVTNLGSNLSYKGGFSLIGNAIGSESMDGSLSEVVLSQAGERKFRAIARNYTFNDTLLLAGRAAVALYQQNDSLTHPAVQLRYSRSGQELTLTKDKGAYAHTPYSDSFHKLEITAERVRWNLNEPQIEFSILSTKTIVPVHLESLEYYSNNRYQQLVGVAPFHPLQLLIGYSVKAKRNEFYASDVARATKISEAAIKGAASAMSHQRFLNYDPGSGYIELKPKAWHYVGASRDLKDYDHLAIKSVVPSGRNATLNLDDNRLTVRGVSKITFNNDTASVYILPRRQEVHVLKNRDIEFEGQVFASQLVFKGTEFKFNYDEFSIDLIKLDTIALVSLKGRSRKGGASEQVLTGKGSSMPGKLYINKPHNKSGEKYFAEYPKFDAPMGALVAFDKREVAGGAYDSTVYFDMPPFKLDSLSSGKKVVAFDGTFHSGGIFPPIKTKLQMMPDGTLGFYYQPSAKGLEAFGGKGVAFDTIMMSSSGIQSRGKLTYLTATLEAPVYTYFKDSVVAKGGEMISIKEGGSGYPVASLSNFEMNWQPLTDTMYLKPTKEPMRLYEESYTFKGTAKYSPGGLYGSGILENPVAKVTSSSLHFKQRSFSGNNAKMVVKSGEGKPAVEALDVALDYDMTKGLVDFESEKKGAASITFPKAQYKTSMSSGRWDTNNQKVSLRADENGGSNWFYSMHPEQGGLRFKAGSGDYNLKDNTIRAGGVPFISVADVYIVPDSGKVAVAADATIQTLRNARVLADSSQQFHKLNKGNIDVLSRMAFKGSAIHNFLNAASDSFGLQFENFIYGNPQEKKKPVYTFATANIKEENAFYIFPRILYRGKITMQAPEKYMDFDGELKLNFTGDPADSGWFPYKKDTLDPENVRIPILKAKAADGTALHTGLHMAADSGKLYNTFVSKKLAEDDLDLFLVDGLLSYDKSKGEFKIGQEARAYGDSYEGSLMQYNEASNTVHFEGRLNLLKPTKNFSIDASGSGDANVDSSRYSLDTFLAFDLEVPGKALDAMAAALQGSGLGSIDAMGHNQEALHYKLAEFIGDRGVRDYIERSAMAYVPLPEVSRSLVRSLILDQVNLRWSNEQNAWYSVGSISLASILKNDINAKMDGYLELRQDMNGDPAVNLYLQADPYTWYYFSFFENGLTLASSDDNFNKVIGSKSKGSRGTSGSYGIYLGEPIEKNQFLDYFSKTYLNGEKGFKVAAGQPIGEPVGGFGGQEEDEKQDKKKRKKKGKEDPFGVEPETD